MRILTFNHHESYLVSLSATGHIFDVVVEKGKLKLTWNESARRVPNNFSLVSFDDKVRENLNHGVYDVIICHTIKNLLWLLFFPKQNCIFVAHIPLFSGSWVAWIKSLVKKLILKFFSLRHNLVFLAVSKFKKDSWGILGHVVVLTPEDVPELSQQGDGRVLIICNQLAARREELGWDLIFEISQKVPLKIVGNNPGVANSIKPNDYQDFCRIISSARIYLYTIKQPYGDGYNTAMLEAMKMGLAIVTVDNPSSPIEHNINGLVASTASELTSHLQYLLSRPDEVARLGQAAKDTIEQKFSKAQFVDGWSRVLTQFKIEPNEKPVESRR